MPAKGNQMIPNRHFHKDWQRYIKTWFNQPARKQRRHNKRVVKAAKIAPRPLRSLRPLVRCPGFKNNIRVKLGRGFTLEELKGAGINPLEAPGIGIAYDMRRRNKSMESLQLNVQRLKEYRSKMILFPKKKKNAGKRGYATEEEMANAVQLSGVIMPPPKDVNKKDDVEGMVITEEMKNFKAFHAIRQARAYKRLYGKRQKKKQEAEEAALATKK